MSRFFPNFISLLRLPLAFLLWTNPLTALSLACLTDILDGYLARSWNVSSRVGALLDPFCDKFFAFFALGLLLFKGQLTFFEIGFFLSREVALSIYTLRLFFKGNLKGYTVKALISGKIMTSLQFLAFGLLFSGWQIPVVFYGLFCLLGITSFMELLRREPKMKSVEDLF